MDRRSDRMVGVILVIIWAVTAIYMHWNEWSVDLSALYFAGVFFGEPEAQAIYNRVHTSEYGARWLAHLADLGYAGNTVAPYIYPPWVAGVLHPIVRGMDPQVFFNAGYVVNILALGGSVLMGAYLVRPANVTLTIWVTVMLALLLTGFPATLSLALNQPQILVNALILGAFVLVAKRMSFTGGGLLAVAASIKLSPLFFAAIFIADRNWRALVGFVLMGLAMVGFDAWISPAGYAAGFLDTLGRIESGVLLSRVNHAFEVVIYTAWTFAQGESLPPFSGYIWVPGPVWIDPVTKALLGVGLVWAMWFTHGFEPRTRLWLRLQLIALLSFLFGPLSWTHYLLFPTLLLPGAVGIVPGPRGWAMVAGMGTVFSSAVYLRMIALRGHEIIPMFWGTAWAILWLLLLVLLVRHVLRPDGTKG